MLPFNCSCVFVCLQTSLGINFGIARDSDTRDMLVVSKMRKKKMLTFFLLLYRIIRDKQNGSILTFI